MSYNKKVIAICGRAQSGKSTLALMMEERAGYDIMSFADPIKNMLLVMGRNLGLHERHLYGSNEDKNEPLLVLGGKSARYAMQTLGTEWRELLAKNLWVNHLDMRLHNTPANRTVIDDTRFEHEYLHLRKEGVLVIGIERPGQGTSNSNHASEQWDFKSTDMPVIQNDGSLEELWAKVQKYL